MTDLILKHDQESPINIEIDGLGIVAISRHGKSTQIQVKSKTEEYGNLGGFTVHDASFFYSYFAKLQSEAELFDTSIVIEEEFAKESFDNKLSIDNALINLLHDTVLDFTTLTPLKGRYYSDPDGLIHVAKNTSAPHFDVEPSIQTLIKKDGTHFFQTNGGKVLIALRVETDGEPSISFVTLKPSYAEEVVLAHAEGVLKESGPVPFMIDSFDSVSLPELSDLGWDVGVSNKEKFCFMFRSALEDKENEALEFTLNFSPRENTVTMVLAHFDGRTLTQEASTVLHTRSIRDEILLLAQKMATSSSEAHFVRSAKANDQAFTKLLAAVDAISNMFSWPESKIGIDTALYAPYAELLNRGELSHDELKQFNDIRWVCYQDAGSYTDLELESSFFENENSLEYHSLDVLLTFNWEEQKLSLTFGLNLGGGFNEHAYAKCDNRPLNVVFDEMIACLKQEDPENEFLLKFTEHELAGKGITNGLRAASVALGLE